MYRLYCSLSTLCTGCACQLIIKENEDDDDDDDGGGGGGGSPFWGVLLYLCLHHLRQNDQIRQDNIYGEGVFSGGQTTSMHLHRNASHGLSATAECPVTGCCT